MRAHPEVIGDLWALYRLDFWEAVMAPRLDVLEQCLARLAHEPGAMTRAQQMGGPEWLWWGWGAALASTQIDMAAYQTQATAVNKRAKFKQVVDRPQPKKHKRVISSRDDVGGALGALLG